MGNRPVWLGLIVGAGILAGASTANAAPAPQPLDRIIVEWSPTASTAQRLAVRQATGGTQRRALGRRFETLTFDNSQEVAKALVDLRADPAVITAEPDVLLEPQGVPDDPDFGVQWALANTGQVVEGQPGTAGADIGALKAWQRTVGDTSALIAIIDSGYRFAHPDLKDRYWMNPDDPLNGIDDDSDGRVDDWRGWDFVGADADANPLQPDKDPTDDVAFTAGHGVHVAGIAAGSGNDGNGITGVAQQATIMPLRVCAWSTQAGEVRCPLSATIAAINYAGSHDVRVANLSLGGYSFSQAERDALAANPRTLYVVAAGNDTTNVDSTPFYPCALDPSASGVLGAVDNVVCVAATTNTDAVAGFSNYGRTGVDLAAPGDGIYSTVSLRDVMTNSFSGPFPLVGWTNDEGWIRSSAAPLTSSGITNDTGTQALSTSRTIVTPTITVNAPSVCVAHWWERLKIGNGESFRVQARIAGSEANKILYSGLVDRTGEDAVGTEITGSGAKSVSFAFTFARGPNQTSGTGAWLDDLRVSCHAPAGQENSTSYGYMSGTSMASPMVTGVAALLASYEPRATVAQLRTALLTSVDPVPALDPNTGNRPVASGGRLDADAALAAIDALVAPDKPTISSGPDAIAHTDDATFVFSTSSTGSAVTYECAIDGAPLRSGCVSPYTITSVAAGVHTFHLKAVDSSTAHKRSPEATYTWTSPGPPPDTVLTSGPDPVGVLNQASFVFASSTANVIFECSVDRAAFAPCTSPVAGGPFSVGSHSFAVRAVDVFQRLDATPAELTWKVLSPEPPETVLESGPGSGADAVFTFSSPTFTATLECSVDEQQFAPCSSPVSLGGLAAGSHTFAVRAVDALDRVDPTPEIVTWTVSRSPGDGSVQPPSQPGVVTVKRKPTKAVLRWSPVPGATTYRVSRKSGRTVQVSSAKVVLKGLKKTKRYRATVVAANPSGGSSPRIVRIPRFRT